MLCYNGCILKGVELLDRLAAFLQQERPKTILDVCTGAGQFIQLVSTLYSDYESIIGIDSLDIAVSTARKNCQTDDRVKVRKMDAHHMTFKDNRFDLVVLSNSFHHIKDKRGLLLEMHRVTKPGGTILISEMISNDVTKAQKNHVEIHHFAAEIDRLLGEFHDPTFTSDELLEVITDASPIEVNHYWRMEYQHPDQTSKEDIEWLKRTIDRMISRIKSKQEQQPFIQRGKQIKQDIDLYGFDSATTMIVVMKK